MVKRGRTSRHKQEGQKQRKKRKMHNKGFVVKECGVSQQGKEPQKQDGGRLAELYTSRATTAGSCSQDGGRFKMQISDVPKSTSFFSFQYSLFKLLLWCWNYRWSYASGLAGPHFARSDFECHTLLPSFPIPK